MAYDCCDSGKLLEPDQALASILGQVQPLTATESIPLGEALGRILAEPLIANLDVPPADNSAMDGYAFALEQLPEDGWLPLGQRICAGDPLVTLTPGAAARIFTGAPVPLGADTVIPQEYCETQGERVRLPLDAKPGSNIRRRGEDITTGSTILQAGSRIRPQEMGMAATLGLARVPVFRKLRVAVFSTGDELAPLGEPLQSGQIYDSNRYTLIGLLQASGCKVIDLGRVADDFASTCQTLSQAAQQADLIITSGGVSVGEEDYVKAAVQQLGEVNLWKIAIKPGKPLAFGRVAETRFFGLPGNPVAAFVTFCLFVRPYLLRCQGANQTAPTTIPVTAQFDWPKPGKRHEYLRARLTTNSQGETGASLYPSQGSGILSSVSWGNGLVIMPIGQTVQQGDTVDFISFAELLG